MWVKDLGFRVQGGGLRVEGLPLRRVVFFSLSGILSSPRFLDKD